MKRIDGCEDEYPNKLRNDIIIETQPPLDASIINTIKKAMTYNETNE